MSAPPRKIKRKGALFNRRGATPVMPANLPNFALDRLSRYEATLWRQLGRILFALDALDRRKPQERGRRSATTAQRFGFNMDFANYRAGASSLADDF
jgi:hypothetical protein